MPVPALELKPRGAMALFDAAIRLCARSSGVWAFTLPGGALVTWALLTLVQALTHGRDLLLPAAGFSAAWIARGVFMGAACHYLDALILAPTLPTTWGSLRAALGRLPSLVITSVYLPLFTALSLTVTVGLGYFFFSAHLVGFAVTMKGRGHPLALYGTCAKLLGAARANASTVRWLFAAIVLVGFNLHIGANALIFLGRKLAGLDLTYAQRFASIDNPEWVTVICALAFALFEPLRAAVATLMLIDGRVRQEGLDLLAAVEQLPRRRKDTGRLPRPGSRGGAAAAVLAVLCVLISSGEARAQTEDDSPDEAWRPPAGASVTQRLEAVARACGYAGVDLQPALTAATRLGPADQAALGRMVDDLELAAWTFGDCEWTRERLGQRLPLLLRTAERVEAAAAQTTARDRAKDILAREAFVPLPGRAPTPAPEEVEVEDPDSFRAKLAKWWRELLEELLKQEREERYERSRHLGGGEGAASFIAVIFIAAVVVIVVVLLVLALRGRATQTAEVDVESTAVAERGVDDQSALSRPPEGWAALADQLADQGRYREAVRSLYLALLSRLHRIGAIDYDPTLSNWDYLRQLRGHREWAPSFRDLTHRFDFAWYGQIDVGRGGYLAFRSLCEPMLATEPGASPPAGGGASGA